MGYHSTWRYLQLGNARTHGNRAGNKTHDDDNWKREFGTYVKDVQQPREGFSSQIGYVYEAGNDPKHEVGNKEVPDHGQGYLGDICVEKNRSCEINEAADWHNQGEPSAL